MYYMFVFYFLDSGIAQTSLPTNQASNKQIGCFVKQKGSARLDHLAKSTLKVSEYFTAVCTADKNLNFKF